MKGAPSRAAVLRLVLLLAAQLAAGACAPDPGGAGGAARRAPVSGEPGAAAAPPQTAAQPVSTRLVDVLELDSTFVLDIRYATPRNFTGRTLYPMARCLLRPAVAERLVRVHARLEQEGLRLRIFDCYRPLSIQRDLWALVPDERYVADPAKGSRHNRGAAVDLTLADSSGAPLPMPTEYDDFTPRAHRDYTGATPEQAANRARLEGAMASEGFVGLPTEWWHFDSPDWKEYAILDVPLTQAAPEAKP